MAERDIAIHIMKTDLDRIDCLVRAGMYQNRRDCIRKAVTHLLSAHTPCQRRVIIPYFTSGWIDKPVPLC